METGYIPADAQNSRVVPEIDNVAGLAQARKGEVEREDEQHRGYRDRRVTSARRRPLYKDSRRWTLGSEPHNDYLSYKLYFLPKTVSELETLSHLRSENQYLCEILKFLYFHF